MPFANDESIVIMDRKQKSKTALVLSGGSMLGAFQAGAIHYLCDRGFQPDIAMGISAGTLNSSFLVNEAGKMNGDLNWPVIGATLKDFWLQRVQKPQDLIRKHTLMTLVWRFFTHRFNGWFDFNPLVKLIQNEFKLTHIRNSPVELVIGAVDWTEGDIEYPDQRHHQLIDFIIASAAIPVILPFWYINNRPYIDGGVRDVVPLRQLIKKGADEIVVILTQPEKLPKPTGKVGDFLYFLERVINLMLHEILLNDLATLEKINHELKMLESSNLQPTGMLKGKRYIKCTVIRPKHSYDIRIQNFSSKDIQQLLLDGQEAAQDVL